jgi:quinol monooxygenase YgiN
MTTLLVTCRVDDYDAWRPRYEAAIQHLSDVRSWRVWHDQDDPNLVVIVETYDSRDVPERLLASDEIQELMAADRVDLASIQVRYLDEDGGGSR